MKELQPLKPIDHEFLRLNFYNHLNQLREQVKATQNRIISRGIVEIYKSQKRYRKVSV